MPAARKVATAAKLVATAAESSTVTKANRVRLSKVLAAKPGGRSASALAPVKQPKSNGAKPKKVKLVSNRYKIPETEYAQLTVLKKRLLELGISAKRGELLRAGLMLLVASGDAQVKKAVAKVQLAKTGRSVTKPN